MLAFQRDEYRQGEETHEAYSCIDLVRGGSRRQRHRTGSCVQSDLLPQLLPGPLRPDVLPGWLHQELLPEQVTSDNRGLGSRGGLGPTYFESDPADKLRESSIVILVADSGQTSQQSPLAQFRYHAFHFPIERAGAVDNEVGVRGGRADEGQA